MARRSKLQDEIRQKRPFATPRQEAVLSLLRTADVLRHTLDAAFKPWGVTSQQYNVLRILRGAHPDPLPTMEIAARMLEKSPGITRFLDRLEQKGFLKRRRRSADRRCVLCSITQKGLDLLAEMDEPVIQADEAALAMLAPTDVDKLIELLDAIRR